MSKGPMVARLKTTYGILASIERGLTGYSSGDYRPSYLFISDGGVIKVAVMGTDVADKFECFSLVLDVHVAPAEPIIPFDTPAGRTITSVLVREEYIAPYTGERSLLLGRDPMVQAAARPGNAPSYATMSCVAAYGLMIEGPRNRLVVAADWTPFNIVTTTDETKILEFLSESEAMPVPSYIEQYGFA